MSAQIVLARESTENRTGLLTSIMKFNSIDPQLSGVTKLFAYIITSLA